VDTSSRPELRLDWCSHEAAKYAVEHWHYSRQLPPFPHARVGVWESKKYIGVILFSRGANKNLFSPFGLMSTQGAELVRVALANHEWPVSRIVAIAIRFLRRQAPGLRLLVSFADPRQGHHGGIYQAGGWIYCGDTEPSFLLKDKAGKLWHPRVTSPSGLKRAFGKIRTVPRPQDCRKIEVPSKHRYLMPLDDEMRARIAPLAKPYPKRAGSSASGTSPDQGGRGGATPTPALSDDDE
jgi:hypothetical protein